MLHEKDARSTTRTTIRGVLACGGAALAKCRADTAELRFYRPESSAGTNGGCTWTLGKTAVISSRAVMASLDDDLVDYIRACRTREAAWRVEIR